MGRFAGAAGGLLGYSITIGASGGVLSAPLIVLVGPLLRDSPFGLPPAEFAAFLWNLPGACLFVSMVGIPLTAPIGALGGVILHLRLAAGTERNAIVPESFFVGFALASGPVCALLLASGSEVPPETFFGVGVVGGTVGMAVMQIVRRRWRRSMQEPSQPTR